MSETTSERLYVYSRSDPPNALVSNGVESLTLHYAYEGKPPVICMLRRSEGKSMNPPLVIGYNQPIVEQTPSMLPPPGNLTLCLNLLSTLGRGRTSVVYEVALDYTNSSSEIAERAIPPLVVKISRLGCEEAMDNEAYYYEEMESLQGIVIPRYYGLFKGELSDGAALVGEDISPCEEDEVGDGSEHQKDQNDATAKGPRLRNQKHSEEGIRHVSILVMEKLGGKMPVGQPLPSDLNLDLIEMYHHLSCLGIDHVDVRHANILEAPPCPPGWPSLVSPLTKMAYRYRLVDFDNSRKSDRTVDAFNWYYHQYIHRFMIGLPLGFIAEPWEI